MEKNIGQNAKYKGDGWMAKVLERIYGHKLLSIFGPLAVAALILVMHLLFSSAPDKTEQVYDELIMAVSIYPGMLLVLGFQLINPSSKPNFMDFVVLFFTVFLGLIGLRGLYELLFHLRDGYAAAYADCWALLSAIALIQSRRK